MIIKERDSGGRRIVFEGTTPVKIPRGAIYRRNEVPDFLRNLHRKKVSRRRMLKGSIALVVVAALGSPYAIEKCNDGPTNEQKEAARIFNELPGARTEIMVVVDEAKVRKEPRIPSYAGSREGQIMFTPEAGTILFTYPVPWRGSDPTGRAPDNRSDWYQVIRSRNREVNPEEVGFIHSGSVRMVEGIPGE